MAVITTLDELRAGKVLRGEAISMRAVDGPATIRNDDGDEVLYILEEDTGIFLPRGQELALERKLTAVGVKVYPDAERREAEGTPVEQLSGSARSAASATRIAAPPEILRSRPSSPPALRINSLHDQPVQKTGDRWYRELIQSEITQFVGSIPPGRAPDHFHLYEEVLCILHGSGFLWMGGSKTPISPGSCVYLPRKQVHCLENTSSGELRLLGVFYPAGSPSVRYEVHERADGAPDQRELDRRS